MYIPYGRQLIDEDDIKAVIAVLRSDYLTTGPKISEFENELCKTTNSKYCVAIANGTAALHAACYAAGVKTGDEVITSPMTFVASSNCILYMGGIPVFADIDSDTYNIDPKEIEKKITSKTKAIIAVDYTGQPCDMDAIYDIAKKHGLIVIEDASHALGARYKDKAVGSISHLTTFSFHPVKHITTGEGGAITTNDKDFYDKLLLFRTHGITRNPDLLHDNQGGWYYEQLDLGYNYRISDIQAALGISQLRKLEGFIARRKEIVQRYNQTFKTFTNITTPFTMDSSDSSWHLYVIKLDKSLDRKIVYDRFQALGIGVNVHYIPVHLQPYYQKLGYTKGMCPIAEDIYEHILSLPIHQSMTDEEVEKVIDVARNC